MIDPFSGFAVTFPTAALYYISQKRAGVLLLIGTAHIHPVGENESLKYMLWQSEIQVSNEWGCLTKVDLHYMAKSMWTSDHYTRVIVYSANTLSVFYNLIVLTGLLPKENIQS